MRLQALGWQGAGLTLAVVAALITLQACARQAESPEEAGPGEATAASEAGDTLYTDSIIIEGMVERIRVRDFETPLGFPLGFRTVVPGDMVVGFVNSGRGDAVRLEAAFGGVRRPDAVLAFTVLPDGTEEDEARERVAALAADLKAEPRDIATPDFAVERYDLVGPESGFIALGMHEGHWYYFLARYPPEFGDGMGPRIDLILRRWRWAADGSELIAN